VTRCPSEQHQNQAVLQNPSWSPRRTDLCLVWEEPTVGGQKWRWRTGDARRGQGTSCPSAPNQNARSGLLRIFLFLIYFSMLEESAASVGLAPLHLQATGQHLHMPGACGDLQNEDAELPLESCACSSSRGAQEPRRKEPDHRICS
jgi:hypothetical protein